MPAHKDSPDCDCWGCIQVSLMKGIIVVEVSERLQVMRGRTWRLRDRLLSWSPEVLHLEGEGPRVGMLKPLLVELQERVRPSGEPSSGGGGSSEPGLPVAANALSLMQDIENEMNQRIWELPSSDAGRPEKLGPRIAYWVSLLEDHPDLIQECHQVLAGWVDRIEVLFDPPVTVELRRSCPACHASYVVSQMVDDPLGESVRNRALVATIKQGNDESCVISCRSCDARWSGRDINQLEMDTRETE